MNELPHIIEPQELQEQQVLTRCEGCPNGQARLVGSRGDPQSPIVIVGESPGKQELRLGLPFMGPSGKVLDHALSMHPDVKPYFLNAIQCYPGSPKTKDAGKMQTATRSCQKRLYDEIRRHPRRIIVALGNPAVWSLTEDFGAKITQIRGQRFKSPLATFGVITAVHPAFLLRGGGSLRQFMADIDYACRLSKAAAEPIATRSEDASDDGSHPALKRYILPEIHVAKDASNIKWLATQIAEQDLVAVDCETGGHNGFDHLRDRILSVGYCWDPRHVYVIPEHLVKATRLIYRRATSRTRFVWHNGKFDQKFHWAQDIPECRVDEDTMLLSYALDETGGIHDLEQLSGDILGSPDWKHMIKEFLSKASKGYDTVPKDILYDYMSRDISATLQIFPFLRRQVQADPTLEKLYTKTLLRMSPYMAKIEHKGLRPNLVQVAANHIEKQAVCDALEHLLNRIASKCGYGPFNPRSYQQVGHFLYDVLKLRDPKKPNKRPDSTDEDTLESLQPHPAVNVMLKHREAAKAFGTYVKSVPPLVSSDGRIHTSYLIHGTTSGRPASRDPNMLNQPRDKDIRNQIEAEAGCELMEVDVNQAELRVLAELSRDPVLHYIYTTPGAPSIHKVTQTEMFGDPKDYTPEQTAMFIAKFSAQQYGVDYMLNEQNMRAKTVNFGIVYGRTAPSIADEFDITVKEAQAWIDAWFRKYAIAHRFIMRCREAPMKNENLVTPFGRKRRFQIVNSERLNDIQNQAANFPEQSIACDIVTETGMRLQDFAKQKYRADIVNTVYDSLLFELPATPDRKAAFELGTLVLKTLRAVPREYGLTHIPFVGDLKFGRSWGDLQKVPLPPDLKAEVEAS